MGLGEPRPRLSWKLESSGRGKAQRAFEIVVGLEADPLAPGAERVWQSGTVKSAQSVEVPYGGEELASRTRYIWRVRVEDEHGEWAPYSEPATFETGLLSADDWVADWIGAPWDTDPRGRLHLENIARIQVAGAENAVATAGTTCFRHRFEVPGGAPVQGARLVVIGAEQLSVWINGERVAADPVGRGLTTDVGALVAAGSNVLAVQVDVVESRFAGIVALLEVSLEGRPSVRVTSCGRWRAFADAPEGWQRLDAIGWPRAEEVGRFGDPPTGRDPLGERPSPYLRTAFSLARPVRRARLYATALGVYHLVLNGARVGSDHLSPGWTDYDKRVAYQTYDVTEQLAEGENVLGAVLGDGWYAGTVASWGPSQYGRRPLLRAQLEITHDDDTVSRISTDPWWLAGEGAVRFADLQMGEVQDARRGNEGWATPGFDATQWPPVMIETVPALEVTTSAAPPIKVQHQLAAQSVTRMGAGRWIVDFGQNVVGWARLRVTGDAGTKVILRHAEVLDHRGELYLANLRTARQIDEYTLRGGAPETFEPCFTLHGFRYLEVSGLPGTLTPADVTARAAYSAMDPTGSFSCSHDGLNRLQQNIVWSQRGNFLAVPTDCPQRDERLGWTGDAQVFAATAAFAYDVRGFFRKWLLDVADAQRPSGAVTHVAPDVIPRRPGGHADDGAGSPGWGDAIAIVPWELHRAYGDLRVAEERFQAIGAWLAWLERGSTGLVRPAEGFGDWLSVGADTPRELIATAFFAYSARLAAELASGLGREDDARHYERLHEGVRQAFRNAFVEGGGQVAGQTQTGYVLALHLGLLEPDEEPRAAARLVDDIEARNWHLSTGFLGVSWLLPVLAAHGYLDVAYRLLLQDSFPSWLFPVCHGATTMWERWDGWSEHMGFQDPAMNSFNHYAYGAVGDWLYRAVAGIDAAAPGYAEIIIRPRPGGGLRWARGCYESVYGRISSSWRYHDDFFELEIEIPANTSAVVHVPASDASVVTEGDGPATEADGVSCEGSRDGAAVFRVGSGAYRFRAPAPLPEGRRDPAVSCHRTG